MEHVERAEDGMNGVQDAEPGAKIVTEEEALANRIINRVKDYSDSILTRPEYKRLLEEFNVVKKPALELGIRQGIQNAAMAITVLEKCTCEETRLNLWNQVDNGEVPYRWILDLLDKAGKVHPSSELKEGEEKPVEHHPLQIQLEILKQNKENDVASVMKERGEMRDPLQDEAYKRHAEAVAAGHDLLIGFMEQVIARGSTANDSLVNSDA